MKNFLNKHWKRIKNLMKNLTIFLWGTTRKLSWNFGIKPLIFHGYGLKNSPFVILQRIFRSEMQYWIKIQCKIFTMAKIFTGDGNFILYACDFWKSFWQFFKYKENECYYMFKKLWKILLILKTSAGYEMLSEFLWLLRIIHFEFWPGNTLAQIF